MELISVIVPVYNVEDYLEKCLDSIINQTYKNLEIILIDDGSTDSSSRICDAYAERDGRIKVIHRKNGGPSEARNDGIAAATGDYIMFVDSDDYMDTDTAQFLIDNAKKHDADISICGFRYADTDGNTREQDTATVNEGVVTAKEFWHFFYSDARIFYVTIWAKLFRRSLWHDLYFPTGKLHEDEFVTHSLVANSKRIAISKKPMYYYVQRGGSIMHTQFMTKNFDSAEGMLVRCEFFCERGEFDIAAKSLTMAMYNIVRGLDLLDVPSQSDKKRVRELKRTFRSLYRRLFLKRTDLFSKIKCTVFYFSTRLFRIFKKD